MILQPHDHDSINIMYLVTHNFGRSTSLRVFVSSIIEILRFSVLVFNFTLKLYSGPAARCCCHFGGLHCTILSRYWTLSHFMAASTQKLSKLWIIYVLYLYDYPGAGVAWTSRPRRPARSGCSCAWWCAPAARRS